MKKILKIQKINLTSIIVAVFTLMIVLDYHGFYMIDYWSIFKGNSLCFITAISGIFFWCVFIANKPSLGRREYKEINKICVSAFVSFAIICLYSILKYKEQPVAVTIVEHISLLYICWTSPLLFCYLRKMGEKKIWRLVNQVCVIWYIILLIQFIEWIREGHIIFIEEAIPVIRTRSYGIRLGLGSLGNIAILYNFNEFTKSKTQKRKVRYGLIFVLGLFCMLFVQQTRAFTAIVLLCIALSLFLTARKSTAKLRIFLIFLVGLSILIYTGTISKFLSSFSESSNESMGTTIRFDAIKYFLQCFIKNPLFGNGFTNYQYYPSVQYGDNALYNYYYTDVGVFGLLAEIGLGATIFYVIPMCKAIKIAKMAFKKDKLKYSFFISFVTFVVLTSFTLIITDTFRAILYPLFLSYALYIEHDLKHQSMSSDIYDNIERQLCIHL